MGYFSIWHWLIVIIILVLLFGGKGKVSSILGDIAKGLKSFKKGFQEDDKDVKNNKIDTTSKNDDL